jgi:GNAT superfamily N-acetyltransferase
MNKDDILTLHRREQREQLEIPHTRRETFPEVIRHVNLMQPRSFISACNLTAGNANAVIQSQIDYFAGMGHQFEWKYYDYDQPADLPESLIKHGFTPEEPEAFTVLDVENAPARLMEPITLDIRRLTDPAQVYPEAIHIQEIIWDEEMGWLAEDLSARLRDHPDDMRVYVGYADDKPVCSAWIYFHPGQQFAGLWGGSTLAEYRGQGFYKALVAQRLRDAQERGVRFLTVDASPMSRPILERLGFQVLAMTTPYIWEPNILANDPPH